MNLQYEEIRPDQLPLLSQFAQNSFRDTYEGFNPPERVAAYLANNLMPHHFAEHLAEGQYLLGALAEGVLVAYAHLGRSQPPAEIQTMPTVELKRFYVASAQHGKGVARPFLQWVLEQMRAQGYLSSWLGVWDQNHRAQAFYLKCGFNKVGKVVFQFEDDPQIDELMVIEIGDDNF